MRSTCVGFRVWGEISNVGASALSTATWEAGSNKSISLPLINISIVIATTIVITVMTFITSRINDCYHYSSHSYFLSLTLLLLQFLPRLLGFCRRSSQACRKHRSIPPPSIPSFAFRKAMATQMYVLKSRSIEVMRCRV